MAQPEYPTLVEKIVWQINQTYARAKKQNPRTSYSETMTWVISSYGINDPNELSRVRSEVGKLMAARRTAKKGGQTSFKFRSPRRVHTG